MLDAPCAVIKDAADALAVIDRALTTIEYMMADPAHCEGTRTRLDKDRVALGEVVRWAQGQLAESWRIVREAHPERTVKQPDAPPRPEAPLLRWSQDQQGGWQCVETGIVGTTPTEG